MSRIEDIKRLIINYSRRLQKRREQVALIGRPSVEPSILIEIEDIEAELEKLQIELDNLCPPRDERIRHNLGNEPPYLFERDKIFEIVKLELYGLSQMIILKGFGGVGKSTLAKKIAYKCIKSSLFETIIWIDLRRYRETQRIDLNTILDIIVRVCNPDFVITQLGDDLTQKVETVVRLLSQHPTLIIFDNFEDIIHDNEDAEICDFIRQLPITESDDMDKSTNIVRAIITTRAISENMDGLQPRVHILEQLSLDSASQFMKRKVDDLSIPLKLADKYEKLYSLTHGIPYLIEVVVGQISCLPFEMVEKHFEFQMPLESSDEIYGYLFSRSWNEILTPEQKQILMGMTYFIEHALPEAISTTANLNSRTFNHCLKGLCDMSLIVVNHYDDNLVYKIHPLTQKLCEVQIKEAPDFSESAGKRFIEYYLQFSKQNHKTNPTIMELEIKNIIAAIKLAEELGEWELLIDFRDTVNPYMWLAGYWPERVELNKSILHACNQLNDELLAAKALVEDLGFTYLRFENLETSEKYVREGLEMYKKLDDEKGIALAMRHLGKSALLKGEYELLEQGEDWAYYFEEALKLYSQSQDIREKLAQSDPSQNVAIADLQLDFGRLYWLWGRKCERDGRRYSKSDLIDQVHKLYDKSIDASREAEKIFKGQSNDRGISKALGNLGNVIKEQGISNKRDNQNEKAILKFDEARHLYEESLEIAERINKIDEIAHAKWGLGEIYELYSEVQGNEKECLNSALKFAEASNQLYRRIATPADIQVTQALVERLRQKLDLLLR